MRHGGTASQRRLSFCCGIRSRLDGAAFETMFGLVWFGPGLGPGPFGRVPTEQGAAVSLTPFHSHPAVGGMLQAKDPWIRFWPQEWNRAAQCDAVRFVRSGGAHGTGFDQTQSPLHRPVPSQFQPGGAASFDPGRSLQDCMKTENRRAQQTRISRPRKAFLLMLSWFKLSLTPAHRRRFRALGGALHSPSRESSKRKGLAVGLHGGGRRGQANARIRQRSSDTQVSCVWRRVGQGEV
jgi:hypothetical protein